MGIRTESGTKGAPDPWTYLLVDSSEFSEGSQARRVIESMYGGLHARKSVREPLQKLTSELKSVW